MRGARGDHRICVCSRRCCATCFQGSCNLRPILSHCLAHCLINFTQENSATFAESMHIYQYSTGFAELSVRVVCGTVCAKWHACKRTVHNETLQNKGKGFSRADNDERAHSFGGASGGVTLPVRDWRRCGMAPTVVPVLNDEASSRRIMATLSLLVALRRLGNTEMCVLRRLHVKREHS